MTKLDHTLVTITQRKPGTNPNKHGIGDNYIIELLEIRANLASETEQMEFPNI